MRACLIFLGVCALGFGACDRFETPTRQQCEQAVNSLVSHSISDAIEKEFPKKGDDSFEGVATELLKGVGQGLLTEALVDERKIAWCEINMSLHDANCLRSAQSKGAASSCGFVLTDKGEITKE